MAATRMTLAGVLLLLLSGCGVSGNETGVSSRASSVPSYVTEPFSHEEQLVAQGAHLVVSDGCAACHLSATRGRPIAPSFASLAGHRVTLTDGRTVLVEERFLHEALLDPGRTSIKGYDPAPMLAALQRLHLNSEPQQVDALTAFIEQVGPESE
jgi:cytochrome c oxidase subunit II